MTVLVLVLLVLVLLLRVCGVLLETNVRKC